MHVLVAPDSFKGSLTAAAAARAMREGAARAGASVTECPLSDGGEGLLEVLAATAKVAWRRSRVPGPMGEPVEARWLFLEDGVTAVIESAEAIGLGLVAKERRAPARTTTFGVGEVMRAALDEGARTLVVGLGGTATTDGGAGMAQALGVVFEGAGAPITAERLQQVTRIDASGRDPRLDSTRVVVLADVRSPLSGPEGAARVFGPQKGASEAEVARLDAALVRLSELAGDLGRAPGDGAAGGLGYGLRVFAGATVQSGAEFVLDAVRFDDALARCDVVLTGEGRLDGQSAQGKIVGAVCRHGAARVVPVVALAGAVGPGASELFREGLTAFFSVRDGAVSEREAMERAAPRLAELAEKVVRTGMKMLRG